LTSLKSVIRSLRAQQKAIAKSMETLDRERQKVEAGLLALRGNVGRPPGKPRKRRVISKLDGEDLALCRPSRNRFLGWSADCGAWGSSMLTLMTSQMRHT
jgi:hypothetical protein